MIVNIPYIQSSPNICSSNDLYNKESMLCINKYNNDRFNNLCNAQKYKQLLSTNNINRKSTQIWNLYLIQLMLIWFKKRNSKKKRQNEINYKLNMIDYQKLWKVQSIKVYNIFYDKPSIYLLIYVHTTFLVELMKHILVFFYFLLYTERPIIYST